MTDLLRRSIQLAVLTVVVLAWIADLMGAAPNGQTLPLWILPLPGSAFAIGGLIAWSLRPTNRVGLLMMGVGVGLLIAANGTGIGTGIASPLGQAIKAFVLSRAGLAGRNLYEALGPLWAVVLLHLLLAFPGGRLSRWVSRGLVAFLYVFVPVFGLMGLYSPFDIKVSPRVVIEYQTVISILYQACFAVSFVLITKRWIQGGHARRRSLSPVLWSLAPLSIAFLVPTLQNLLPQIVTPQSNVPSSSALGVVSSFLLIVLPIGVLIGLLRSGLDMTSVASLVVKLSHGLQPAELQPALARVLHDPSLEVVYWVPSLDAFADLNGHRVDLPGPDSDRAASVLEGESIPIAALVYDASLLDEPDLVDTAAAAVSMALKNAGLQVQLRAQLDEVRQSRARLVEAGQLERQRVERDLHDGAQQQLVALLLALRATRDEAMESGNREMAAMLDSNVESLKRALSELRELARGIHPSILTEAGLVPALNSLADRSPIPVEVTADCGEDRLPPQLETALYFVASEAITNAVKHSAAHRIRVTLHREAGTVTLEVLDDGHGGAALSAGTGLRGLSDRVAAVGGQLLVQSDARRGTTIHSEIPCG